MRNADRTWNTPVWALAREYAGQNGMKAAWTYYGTTGYVDEDMRILTALGPVKFRERKPERIVQAIDMSSPGVWNPKDGLAARETTE